MQSTLLCTGSWTQTSEQIYANCSHNGAAVHESSRRNKNDETSQVTDINTVDIETTNLSNIHPEILHPFFANGSGNTDLLPTRRNVYKILLSNI